MEIQLQILRLKVKRPEWELKSKKEIMLGGCHLRWDFRGPIMEVHGTNGREVLLTLACHLVVSGFQEKPKQALAVLRMAIGN